MDHPEGFLKLVKDAKKRIKEEDYREVKKKIDSGHPLVLVDTREDGGFRSALAADNLQKMGYSNVISMDGGWRGWTESGFPVIKD